MDSRERIDVDVYDSNVFNDPDYTDSASPIADDQIPLKVEVKQATQFAGSGLKCYPLSSNPRGHVYIIDNEEFVNNIFPRRRGSHVDSTNLKILFEGLGFKVLVERNQTGRQMYDGINIFSQRKDHGDMSVLVVLSHGSEDGFYSCDGRLLSRMVILEMFNNDKCPRLRGKPKFFIFQACRGGNIDIGCVKSGGSTSTDGPGLPSKDPTWLDMLVANATILSYVANRNIYRGSWYIESICQIFMAHAHDTDVRDMLDLVGERMRMCESKNRLRTKQSCSYEVINFNKKVFFNPGFPLDQSDSSQSHETERRLDVEGLESAQDQRVVKKKKKKSSFRLFINDIFGRKSAS